MAKVRHNVIVEFLYDLCYGFLKLLALLTYVAFAITFLIFLPLAILIKVLESINKDINKPIYHHENF